MNDVKLNKKYAIIRLFVCNKFILKSLNYTLWHTHYEKDQKGLLKTNIKETSKFLVEEWNGNKKTSLKMKS